MGLEIDITKKVNGFCLDVSWRMESELVVLFGRSGAGKSLTLQLIAGLMEPDSGFIRSGQAEYFNRAKYIDVAPHRRSVGFVFQDLALFPHMSVKENILYGAKGAGRSERNERLRELTERFRIQSLADKYPSEISGGQKQRVAFARALMRRPEVLLLDEPFSALDNPLRFEMRDFLLRLREDFDIPVVLVTHDIQEAYSMPDKLVVYSGGTVAQVGAPADVFRSPASEEVAELVSMREICWSLSPAAGDIAANDTAAEIALN